MPKHLSERSPTVIQQERMTIQSRHIDREVVVDLYYPPQPFSTCQVSLLLINDGQDLVKMQFENILESLYGSDIIRPILCLGIHAGTDRKNEYGIAGRPDFMGRGAKAHHYTAFIFEELLPWIYHAMPSVMFHDKSFCGFSLGGLMALDIVWRHPSEFRHVGVFSGSLWWRSTDLQEGYDESKHRIMHAQIRKGCFSPSLKFFFEAGLLDETSDRNGNGIIDSVDDTLDLISELQKKGYENERQIRYLELKDGKHDVPTWRRAFPEFLTWAFGK